mmetsp:Transcript_29096/g.70255  ORF Transcript_29096/g.70255 Transcript_29096/m.70255 type:complete len:283 (-) Transcript_29096:238-1086(-)
MAGMANFKIFMTEGDSILIVDVTASPTTEEAGRISGISSTTNGVAIWDVTFEDCENSSCSTKSGGMEASASAAATPEASNTALTSSFNMELLLKSAYSVPDKTLSKLLEDRSKPLEDRSKRGICSSTRSSTCSILSMVISTGKMSAVCSATSKTISMSSGFVFSIVSNNSSACGSNAAVLSCTSGNSTKDSSKLFLLKFISNSSRGSIGSASILSFLSEKSLRLLEIVVGAMGVLEVLATGPKPWMELTRVNKIVAEGNIIVASLCIYLLYGACVMSAKELV